MTKTSIEWTDVSWNVLRGCARVSAGLVRIGKDGKAKAQWSGEVRFIADKLAEPLTWKKPKRVFVNSMSDLFHEGVSFEQIAAIFGVMAAAPRHTFQVLTKRPERARAFFRWYEGESGAGGSPYAAVYEARSVLAHTGMPHVRDALSGAQEDWPLANVWLGVSVEDQASADKRIPHLLECPAAVRWVSYEPAIGPVDFTALHASKPGLNVTNALRGDSFIDGVGEVAHAKLDWVVVGGESGPGARPFDLAWARSAIAQCAEAGTACFVKQLGARPVDASQSSVVSDVGVVMHSTTHECAEHWAPQYGGGRVVRPAPVRLKDRKGGAMIEWPTDLCVRQWPAPPSPHPEANPFHAIAPGI